MSRKAPPNLRSLEARLRNLARDQGVPEGRIRRLISIVVLGQLLERTGVAIIKGASNIEVRLGTRATRVSSDLDTVRVRSLADFRDELALALRSGWADFTGLLIDDGEISAPVPDGYRPHRFRVKLQYRGGAFGTVTVEASAEEINGVDRPDVVAVQDAETWFAELGLPDPRPIPTLALPHQIVQKLHACTAPDNEDWINDRAHDLVDLQLAHELFDGSLAEIQVCAVRLFDARRLHAWPPIVTAREGWEARYAAEAQGLNVLPRLDAAIVWANAFIADVTAV